MHVAECTDFEIDIEGKIPYTSNCIKHYHVDFTNDNDFDDTYAEYDDETERASNSLNKRGYK